MYYSDRPDTIEKAIEAFNKAIALNPGHASAAQNLAVDYAFAGRFDKAEGTLRTIASRAADWRGTSLARATVHLYAGRTAGALAALNDAASASTDKQAAAHVRLEIAVLLLERGRLQDAAQHVQRAIADAGPSGTVSLQSRAYAALIDMRLGRRGDAAKLVAALQKEAADLPGDVDERDLHLLAGRIALDSGDPAGAVRELTKAEALLQEGAGASVELWHVLGAAHLAAGNVAQAAARFERAAKSGAQHGLAALQQVRSVYALAQIADRMGQRDKARGAYKRLASFWKDADIDRDRVADAKAKS